MKYWLDKMQQDSFHPDEITFRMFLMANLRKGDVRAALDVFQVMR